MRTDPSERIHRDALKVWRISGIIATVIYCLIAAGLFVIAFLTGMPKWIAVIAGCLALLLSYISIWPEPMIRWWRWRYEVTEDEIDLQRGVIIIKRTLVPMVRVQHVDTKQGPLLRKYKLATVTISTAATTHEIPALSEEVASTLRDRIAELARVDDDV